MLTILKNDDWHSDYPLAPEKLIVTKEILFQYQLQIIKENKFFLDKNEKLILNLGNKKNKKVMGFKLTAFFKTYIEHNKELPKQAEKEGKKIKKQKYKLRNSAIFSISIKNPKNTFDVKILTNRKMS